MSKVEMVRQMYGYNRWANERLLDTAAAVDEAELKAPQSEGYLPILATFAHILLAQNGWLALWKTGRPSDRSFGEAFQSLEGVREALKECHLDLSNFVDGLTDERLGETLSLTDQSGESFERQLWPMMVHVFNHGTYHRSEIALRLSDLGHSPGDLDYVDWMYPD